MDLKFSRDIFWIFSDPPQRLAIVLCPRGGWELRDELRKLQLGGIQTLVSLLEVDEAERHNLGKEERLAQKAGMQFLSFPIPDHCLPPDEAAFRAFVGEVVRRLRAGERVGVHCLGSIGRATVTAACALIEIGWEPEAAVAAISMARGCSVPDTNEQHDWILNYRAKP
jgi:protein-tyrosine phosphatase